MDASTVSAFAATAAAIAAAGVAAVQFYVGHRQSKAALLGAQAAMMNAKNAGRHTIAASRQSWINSVIESLSEYHAHLMAIGDAESPSRDGLKRLTALRTKLEILLNPEEEATTQLLAVADKISMADETSYRVALTPELIGVARKLLKTEWVRIKTELQAE